MTRLPARTKLSIEMIGLFDHEVRIDGNAGHRVDLGLDLMAHRDVRHEVAVHHVVVDPVDSSWLSSSRCFSSRPQSAQMMLGASASLWLIMAPLNSVVDSVPYNKGTQARKRPTR